MLVLGTNIAVLLDCPSRLDSVAFLTYLLTLLTAGGVAASGGGASGGSGDCDAAATLRAAMAVLPEVSLAKA